jgi:peroxiredoxin
MIRMRAWLAPVAAAVVLGALAVRAGAVEEGQVVPLVTLPRAGGGAAPLVDRAAAATVIVFFRVPHERSEETLRMLAACQPRLAGRQVGFVGVVPPDSAAAAAAAVEASGARLPVLVDVEEAVYAAARVRMHPMVAVVDRSRRVVAAEPFHQVGYCEAVVARVRRALGEIDDAAVAEALAPPASQLPDQTPAGVARRHLALGRKHLAARSFAHAHESARRAIALAPSADAWRLEGDVFAAEGRCADAVVAFDAALALDPKDGAASAARQACGR